jgi:hypothetical protein
VYKKAQEKMEYKAEKESENYAQKCGWKWSSTLLEIRRIFRCRLPRLQLECAKNTAKIKLNSSSTITKELDWISDHIEDRSLGSINYMHGGHPKFWRIIAPSFGIKYCRNLLQSISQTAVHVNSSHCTSN